MMGPVLEHTNSPGEARPVRHIWASKQEGCHTYVRAVPQADLLAHRDQCAVAAIPHEQTARGPTRQSVRQGVTR